MRLFCLPHAGGCASSYRSWLPLLPPEVELCAIQLPGRESRLSEPPFECLDPLIQELAQAIRPYDDAPFAVFGHSLGALLAFELARQFRREQRPRPLKLYVSGRTAPQIPDKHQPIHDLPDSEFLEKLRRYNGTPEEVLHNPEIMELLLPALRSDFAVHESYKYKEEAPLECPIASFGGAQDPHTNRNQLNAWQIQTLNPLSTHVLPGDHFFIQTERTVLVQIITSDMIHLLDPQSR